MQTRLVTIVLSVAVFSLLLVGFYHPIEAMQQDLGRHFLLGKLILKTHQVPKINLFSYTYPQFPFINTHWLSEVIFYLIYSLVGFPGLFLMMLLTVAASYALVFFQAVKRAGIFPAAVVSLFALRILFERTDLRPEIFSFLLLSIFLLILYSYRKQYTHWLFLLIPLEIVWVNLHIYFAIGIMVIGLFFIDELITKRKRLQNKHTGILLLVLTLSTYATLLNPNGLSGATYPFRVFANYGYTIEENQSIFLLESLHFNKPSVPFFELSVILAAVILLFSFRKTSLIDWLLVFIFSYLGATAVRNLALYALIIVIPLSTGLRGAYEALGEHLKPLPKSKRTRIKLILTGILLIVFLWQMIVVAHIKGIGYAIAPGAERAVSFYQKNNVHGPLFNNFDIGSYLIYRLYPKEKVFVDGRPEAYPASFFQSVYIPMEEDSSLFAKLSDKYHFNSIFFSHTDQTPWANTFLTAIIRDPSWKIVYFDDFSIILLKNTPENTAIISRYGKMLDNLATPFVTSSDKDALLRLASFFSKTNLPEQTRQILERLVSIDPENCQALSVLSSIYAQTNNPAGQAYTTRYAAHCQ